MTGLRMHTNSGTDRSKALSQDYEEKEESAANTLAKKDLPTPFGEQEMLQTAWGPSEAFIDLGYTVHLL